MNQDTKVQCLKCEKFYYLRGTDTMDVIPEGAQQGEAFKSICPFCNGQYAMLTEQDKYLRKERGFPEKHSFLILTLTY